MGLEKQKGFTRRNSACRILSADGDLARTDTPNVWSGDKSEMSVRLRTEPGNPIRFLCLPAPRCQEHYHVAVGRGAVSQVSATPEAEAGGTDVSLPAVLPALFPPVSEFDWVGSEGVACRRFGEAAQTAGRPNSERRGPNYAPVPVEYDDLTLSSCQSLQGNGARSDGRANDGGPMRCHSFMG
ncbi:hypothetical protein SKAU_G00336220 [Synaphobranchus kaupii]|uniref:Uncharacterized protein n=1 Tax=Synaphobranchus kaupii TaxID=118154 RepID=A0A9Q1EM76_SYNKA|nr:hypothetical protein SKAU_G00336220 [Synaphobranchus kaupii]